MKARTVVTLSLLAWGVLNGEKLPAHEGWGVVRDAHGRVYVSDIPANTIWRIDPNGEVVPVLRDVHSHSLVLGSDGAVYGTDVHLTEPVRSLWRLDMSGRVTTVIPPTRGLALDLQPFLLGADGAIYSVSVHEFALPPEQRKLYLLRRSTIGRIDTLAGGLKGHADGQGSNARFSAVDGMAWLPNGAILIVDGARLRSVTLLGEVVSLTDGLTELSWDQDLMGASVTDDGAVYVADFAGRRVLKVERGTHRLFASTGFYWAPTGVLATPDAVYALEHPRAPFGILGDLRIGAYMRVRKISSDGSSEVLTRAWGERSRMFGAVTLGMLMVFGGLIMWRRI